MDNLELYKAAADAIRTLRFMQATSFSAIIDGDKQAKRTIGAYMQKLADIQGELDKRVESILKNSGASN